MMKKKKNEFKHLKRQKRLFSLVSTLIFMSFMIFSNMTYADEVLFNNYDSDVRKLSANESKEVKTPIMGQPAMSKGQAFTFLRNNNSVKSNIYIEEFTAFTWEEAQAEGVRPDVAFCLMMKETGYLKFGGDVKEEQNNFAGIGATGGGNPGNSFPSIQVGIRAVVQHLKAYASKEPLKKECVDPRYHLVTKGCAPNVEDLSGRWAVPGVNYGQDIVKMIERGSILEDHMATASVSDIKFMDGTIEVPDNLLFNNKTYKIVVNASSSNITLYQFWIKDNKTSKFTMLRDYGTDNSIEWKAPSGNNSYSIGVYVKDKYSPNGTTKQGERFEDVTIKSGNAKMQSFAIYSGNKRVNNNSLTQGKEYTLRATSVTDTQALYKFWIKDVNKNKWTMLRDYSESNTFKWNVNVNPENYLIGVHVKDKYSVKDFDEDRYTGINVRANNVAIESFNLYEGNNVATKLIKNRTYTIKASAKPTSNVLYKFWMKDNSNNKVTILNDYSETTSLQWKAIANVGQYTFGVDVKEKGSLDDKDATKSIELNLSIEPAKLQTFKVYEGNNEVTTGVFMPGKTYTIKATATSGVEPMYEFWIKDLDINSWGRLRDYGTSNTYTWTAPTTGEKYLLGVHVKDRESTERLDDHIYTPISIYQAPKPVQKKKIVVDAGHGNKNLKYNTVDSGAVGIGGIKESDLTKSLADKLGSYLAQYNYDILYTRNYLKGYNATAEDLKQRVDVANNNKADLFVSLHFDSSTNSSASGVSTHYSSYRPNLDNSGLVTIGDIVYDKTPCKEAIASKELSIMIAKRLAELGFNNRGESDHNLYVTKNTNMPSLLVEGGFVSNAQDVARIKDPNMQKKMAEKIGQAIRDFIK